MPEQNELALPVTIELGASLHHLATPAAVQSLQYRLRFQIDQLLKHLGLAGTPAVTVATPSIGRAVRVRVHGRIQPYTLELMRRAWWTVGPRHHKARFAFFREGADHFPDEWLMNAADSQEETEREAILDFIFHLALNVIRRRPGCLLSRAQAAATLEQDVAADPLPSLADAEYIMRFLLNRGVSLANGRRVLALLSEGREAGWSRDEIAQHLFRRLHSHRVEIHAHPDYLWAITGREWERPVALFAPEVGDDGEEEAFQAPFALMVDGLFYELGIQPPDLYVVPSSSMQIGLVAVKVNDHLGAPALGLRPDEILVNRPAQLSGETPALNPANKNECAIVSRDSELPPEIDTWKPHEYLVLFTYGELVRLADRLVTVDDAEYYLARLAERFPDLVRAVFDRYALADVAALLQGLVGEGISIRNLRAILEDLLRFDTIEADASRYIIFDQRLSLPPGTQSERHQDWRTYLEFVRQQLKKQISHHYTRNQSVLHVFLVDPNLEKRLLTLHETTPEEEAAPLLTEAEEEAFRDQVWYHLDADAGSLKPALLTSSQVRPFLRDLLSPELPDVPVLAYEELDPALSIQPLARITLAAPPEATMAADGETMLES
ncbi:MAG: FHIPEP family type III secretion protein [Candidatus Promineifilaceae bacterium]|nr:FHIPEP family type III secretion protein [Candidatus Promineifilaceae bacterium]